MSHETPPIGVGVCSWSLRPSDPGDLADRLARLGVGGVQLALNPLIDDPAVWAGAIDTLRSAGLAILSGMMATEGENYATLDLIARTGGVRPDATWPANRRRAEATADLAAAAGVELVTFHAGFLPEERDDPERAVMLERLREIADLFADRGGRVAFETGQETAPVLAEVLADLGRENVGVNFDPANMILYGKGDPVEALSTLAPHVMQIHIKDALPTDTPGTWGREVPAGAGAVDWPAFFAAAKGIGRDIDFVIEREAGENREGDIIAARELIEEMGIRH